MPQLYCRCKIIPVAPGEIQTIGEVMIGPWRYWLLEEAGDVLAHLARVKERLRRAGAEHLPLCLLQGSN